MVLFEVLALDFMRLVLWPLYAAKTRVPADSKYILTLDYNHYINKRIIIKCEECDYEVVMKHT